MDPADLGSRRFRAAYGLRYAYLAGAMYKGIASPDLVAALGRAGLLGYLGLGGLAPDRCDALLRATRAAVPGGTPFGANLLRNPGRPDIEEQTVDLLRRHAVPFVEAAAFAEVTPALVRLRLAGLHRGGDGRVVRRHRILAKVSRPEVAAALLRPAPEQIVTDLVRTGQATPEEAAAARLVPLVDELCVEADSGGHTDQGVAAALLPAMLGLRDAAVARHCYTDEVAVGAAGGIGTPHAVAAAFVMGADFVLTGSVNQCTVEAATSDAVKDLLADLGVQDTGYAPAGDLFEAGARVQVARRGLLFAARANKLYELYHRHGSLDDIDPGTRRQLEQRYFRRTLDEVWQETAGYWARADPAVLAVAESSPKRRMALVFRWYFVHTTRLALAGSAEQRVDYQIHCGPAMGAFNEWVRGTGLESWRHRRVADIADRLMTGAAALIDARVRAWGAAGVPAAPTLTS